MSALNLPALREFANSIKKDPSILFVPELNFLLSALSIYGELKLPTPPEDAGHDHHHDHSHSSSHDHGHAHSHDHGGSCNHTAHEPISPENDPQTLEEADEPEEEDPDRLDVDLEPFLTIPAGGEGNQTLTVMVFDLRNL